MDTFDSVYQQLAGTPSQTPNATPTSSDDFNSVYASLTGITPHVTPQNVKNAQQYIGKPIDQGYCETFAEQMSGLPNMGGSAGEAWNNFAQQGKANPDISQAPAGSLIYFQPDTSNGGFGHVGINNGDGTFTSATYKGVQSLPLDQWMQETGQKPLGFVTP